MIDLVTAYLTAYQLPAVFVGAFFFGDSVIFTASYLAGQLHSEPVSVFLTALFGTMLADTAWFLSGRYFQKRIGSSTFMLKERHKASVIIEKLMGKNPLYALILVKFLYGSRIAMILYVAARGMRFGTFSIYNTVGDIVWLGVFFPVGYLVGTGFARTFPLINSIEAAFAVLVVSFIVIRGISMYITRSISKQ